MSSKKRPRAPETETPVQEAGEAVEAEPTPSPKRQKLGKQNPTQQSKTDAKSFTHPALLRVRYIKLQISNK